ncbi:MAG: hypothetical protein HY577_01525 [Candidatus Nealsonbacteria bacterium]|nr:hypothetical protein [Candidatus Nealsonbacteria bacterium]
METLKRIQAKPENERKAIFWLLVIVMGFSLFFVWLALVKHRLTSLNQGRLRQELKLPELEKQINSLPKPELDPDSLKQLEELLRQEATTP